MPDINAGVAIVDDEVDLIRTYELIFKRKQMPISFTAFDGRDAIEKYARSNPKPKLAIIDNRLPDVSGIDVMKELLAIEPRVKIIFISGDVSSMGESPSSGAAAFLKKPISVKEIVDTIHLLMNT